MADKFDPYREALVLETTTLWPAAYDGLDTAERERIEKGLHGDPQHCTELEYVRVYTGFCRQITVTPPDIERLSKA